MPTTTETTPLPPPPPFSMRWALFLDVDGSLLEFASRPDGVHVPAGLVDTLQRLHARLDGALALISGRSLAQLDGLFAPLQLPAAGLHGFELRGAPEVEIPPALHEARARAEEAARAFPGAHVEDKGAALALHWRAAPEAADALNALARQALEQLPDYRLQPGNHVVELRPEGSDKGAAVEALMEQPPFRGRVPVFVGDDLTDEDGFRRVREHGGHAVLVGDRRPTHASFALTRPAAVRAWLHAIAHDTTPLEATG